MGVNSQRIIESIAEIDTLLDSVCETVCERSADRDEMAMRLHLLGELMARRTGNVIPLRIALGFIEEADAPSELVHLEEKMAVGANQRASTKTPWSWLEFCKRALRREPIIPAGDEWDMRKPPDDTPNAYRKRK